MKYTVEKRADRGTYRVRWIEDSRKKHKSFPTKTEAEMWADDMQRLADAGASSAEVMAATREAAGTGYTMDELVRAGLEHVRGTGAARADGKMTFSEAAVRVTERAVKKGARPVTITGYTEQYSILNATWGARVAAMLTEKEVEAYLDGLKGRKGPAAQATKENHLRHIRMAMRSAGVVDPLKGIHVAEVEKEVEFFTVSEAVSMLARCPTESLGFLAVAMFAGVRPENLAMLPASSVSVSDRRIRIPGEISKDTHPHILESDILPTVLWRWLKKYPYKPVNWAKLQRVLKRIVGRWVHDGLRHTAATYYYAIHGKKATARLLTHAGEKLVRENYAGVVEQSQAKRFYIEPGKVKRRPVQPRSRSKVIWPTDEALKTMLQARPAVEIASDLGCSDSALIKRCRVRGINKPGRGHWTQVAFLQSA